jgi:hypothetical protein
MGSIFWMYWDVRGVAGGDEMNYRCRHFKLPELAPPEIIAKYGPASFWFIDPNLLRLIDLLRDRYGAAYVNSQGATQRGLRTDTAISKPGVLSLHYQGKAADMTFPGSPSEEIRQDLYKLFDKDGNPGTDPIAQLLRGVEENVSWLHVDVRNAERLVRFKK